MLTNGCLKRRDHCTPRTKTVHTAHCGQIKFAFFMKLFSYSNHFQLTSVNLFDALLTTQKAIVFIIQLTDFSAPNSRNCNWNTVVQVQQRTRICLLSKVLSCCLPCRHVMCEVIIIRLPGSHAGAWHRVVWVTITINTLSYEQLENIWANCWFLITDLLGSVIHSYSL